MIFAVRSINLNCSAIDNAAGKTVAFVTPQGYVDWLLRSPQESGERLAAVDKETHLGNVRGLKFNLFLPGFCDQMTGGRVAVSESSELAGLDVKWLSQGRLTPATLSASGSVSLSGSNEQSIPTPIPTPTPTKMRRKCVACHNGTI